MEPVSCPKVGIDQVKVFAKGLADQKVDKANELQAPAVKVAPAGNPPRCNERYSTAA